MNRELTAITSALIGRMSAFPKEAITELFHAIDEIEERYDLIPPLTEEQRQGIINALASLDAGEGLSQEEFDLHIAEILPDYDRAAAGR